MSLETVQGIVMEHLGLEKAPNSKDSFVEALGADSLDNVEILLEVEQTFSVKFSDDEKEGISNIESILELLKKRGY